MPVAPLVIEYLVRGYDTGYGGPLRPLALADYFQEAAGVHAGVLGVGMEAVFSLGRTWMLARIDIGIDDLPRTGDRVTVRTWPAGTDRIFAMRHLELLAADGRRLAGARYNYFIYDILNRRPLRPERILDPDMKGDLPPPRDDLSPGLQDVPAFQSPFPGEWNFAFRIGVGERHIDNNGHVNNAHFIDWLCDAAPAAHRGAGRLSRITCDFISEAKVGEEISSWWRKGEDGRLYSILARDGEIIARGLARLA